MPSSRAMPRGVRPSFRILQVCLEHCPGGASRIVQRAGQASDPLPAVFDRLIGFPMGGPVCVSVRFYPYGTAAIALADEIEAAWSAWLVARLPARA